MPIFPWNAIFAELCWCFLQVNDPKCLLKIDSTCLLTILKPPSCISVPAIPDALTCVLQHAVEHTYVALS